MGLGAVAVMGLVALGFYKSSEATAKVRLEQAHISALSQAIETSLGLVGSFASVSVERVVADRLVPPTLLQGTTLRNAWGGPVEVAPYAYSEPNDSFAVVYGSVPAKACVDLGAAVGSQVADLKVNGQSTLTAGEVDPALLASRCHDGGKMLFVFHTGLATGSAVAATPVTNPPPIVAPPSTPPGTPGTPVAPPTAPPVVVTPPVVVAPPPVVAPPTAPPVAPPPGTPGVTPPASPPAGPPAAPPGNAPTCLTQLAAHPDVVSTRTTTPCTSGRYGVVGEQRTQDWFCPDYYGNPSTGSTYEPWATPTFAMTPWTQVSNTCALCPTPQTETLSQWVPASALCPTGQSGTHSWEKAQSHTRGNTVSCGTATPAGPTAGMSVSPWSAWTAWVDTGATRNAVNTCAPNCVLPTPSVQSATQAVTESRTLVCPATQTGTGIEQARTLQQQRTRTAFCPAPTGAYSWGAWSAWSTTSTGAWVETSRDCTPPPATGVCTGRPITIGCATYNSYTGVRLTSIDIQEDNNGGGFQNGQHVRCTIGFADSLSADGFPSMDGLENNHRLKITGGMGLDDWDSSYGYAEDTSVYVTVYAKLADGTQGPRCFGTSKVMFNYDP